CENAPDGLLVNNTVLQFLPWISLAPSDTMVTLDCQGRGRAFRIKLATLSFRNFRFINGAARDGGVFHVEYSAATLTFVSCTFENNVATYGGGVIALEHVEQTFPASILFVRCLLSGNAASRGGVIAVLTTSSSGCLLSMQDNT